ncbi:MAG: M48 family metallopeptidase [Pseudomonadales bacterium]|nr:M48 family metallopeptidase [Pseudomonadales bacterium]MCP5182909.1 M48 family metallopeptidase [Pseudomonadales bacterium]
MKHLSRARVSLLPGVVGMLLVCALPAIAGPSGESLRRETVRTAEVLPSRSVDTLQLPTLGDASSRIISPQLERQIGEDFLRQLYASLPTSRDPLLKYYVSVHVSQLATYSELADALLRAVLIDNKEINAFAAPGGVIGVNAGLFLYAEDVNEYSSVLAHELAHLSQRHFARGVEEAQQQTIPTVASLIAAIAIAAMGGGDAGLAALSGVQAAAQARQLRYSRARETEADRIGINTLVRAGLDPQGMPRMFERMHQAYRFTRTPPEFLLTHPLTDTRVADTRQQVRSLGTLPHQRHSPIDAADYALMRARTMVHYADSPQAAVASFEKRLKENPDDTSAEYGLALALAATGKHDAALAITESLLGTDPQKILYICAHAEALIDAGRAGDAANLLSRHLVLNPDNAPLSTLYAQALSAQHQYADAQTVLERQSLLNPRDIDVWYDLAETAGLASDVIGVHRARAEFFALHGSYSRAIQHLEYAQRLISRTDRRLRAQIDQRIMDLREALRTAQS